MEFTSTQELHGLILRHLPKLVLVTREVFEWLEPRVPPLSKFVTHEFEPFIRMDGAEIHIADWRPPKGILDLTGEAPVIRGDSGKIGGTDPE